VRRDKLGRRIGLNAWRDHITECWRAADHAWWCDMEDNTSLYDTEVREWRASHPRPMLKDFMLALSEGWSRGRIAA
jgi:hypothetical protein